MASKLWLYGNSAADLGPQERAWAGFYQGAAENNRAAADRANQINANLILQQQQADEAAMVRDQARNIDLWRYGVDLGNRENYRRLQERELALRERQYAPDMTAYSEASQYADALTPEQLKTYFGAAGPRLNPLLDAAHNRQAQIKTIEQQEAARQEQKNLAGLFNSVSSGKVSGTPEELSAMFGVAPAKAAPVVTRAAQQWAERTADLLNQQTAKQQLAALSANREGKRADPMLSPEELNAIRLTVVGVPSSVRYDPIDKKWTTAPSQNFSPVMGRLRESERVDLARYAPTATATTPPPMPARAVIPQTDAPVGAFPTMPGMPDLRRFGTPAPLPATAPRLDAVPSVARPQTKAEYDALPPGTNYVDPQTGRIYRKR